MMTEQEYAEKIGKIYETYLIGDPITDEELAFAIPYLEDKVQFLHKMGDRFHFAWVEVFQFQRHLTENREARKPSHLRWRNLEKREKT